MDDLSQDAGSAVLAGRDGPATRAPRAQGSAAVRVLDAASAASEAGLIRPGDALLNFYRWGWIPLMLGCGAVATLELVVWHVALESAGRPATDSAMTWLNVARGFTLSAVLAAYAGLFVWRSRARLEAERRRLLAEELRLQEQEVRAERNAGLAAVTRVVAHEVRNPLNSMSLHCQLLKRAAAKLPVESGEAVERLAGVLEKEIERLDSLVDSYLYAKDDVGLRREPVRLGILAQEVLEVQRGVLDARNIEAKVVVVGTVPPLQADPQRMQQLLHNLVRNAMEALPGGGHIGISVARDEDHVELRVTDDGPGFEDPDTAFRPFYTTKAKGTGLGLAIVRDIVRAHGGSISARNMGPGGRGHAQVAVRLPLGGGG